MKALILETKGLRAIVLFPGGEIRSIYRRRGWKTGMIVDPDAVRSGGFARASMVMASVLLLALGIFGYRMIGSRGADNVVANPPERPELTLPDPQFEAEAVPAVSPTPDASPDVVPAVLPTEIPTALPTETPIALPAETPASASAGHHESKHHSGHDDDFDDDFDDDDLYEICDECGEMGHDDDEHCDFCGVIGHEDDDCPLLPEGWDPETCDYCGLYGHDDDHCPAAPSDWDD